MLTSINPIFKKLRNHHFLNKWENKWKIKTRQNPNFKTKEKNQHNLFQPALCRRVHQYERSLFLLSKRTRSRKNREKLRNQSTKNLKMWWIQGIRTCRPSLSKLLNLKSSIKIKKYSGLKSLDWDSRRRSFTRWLCGLCFDQIFLLDSVPRLKGSCYLVLQEQEKQW